MRYGRNRVVGVGAVAAVILAVMANQTSLGWKRDQVAAADLTGRRSRSQQAAKEDPQRGAAACLPPSTRSQRPGPALYPRHHAGTGPGLGDRRDCAPETSASPALAERAAQAAQNPAPAVAPVETEPSPGDGFVRWPRNPQAACSFRLCRFRTLQPQITAQTSAHLGVDWQNLWQG